MKLTISVTGLLILVVIFTACTSRKSDKSIITGQFNNASGELLILQALDTKEIHDLDSVTIDASGKFGFQFAPPEKGFYLLKAATGKILVILLDKQDTISLGGNYTDFPDNISFQGKQEATLLHDFFVFTRKNEKAVDSLEMLLVAQQDSAGYYKLTLSLDTAFQKIWYRQKSFEEDFISRNSNSLTSLIVLNYSFGMSPVLSPEEDFGYYLSLDSALSKACPGNKHVIYHHQRVKEHQRQSALKKIEK